MSILKIRENITQTDVTGGPGKPNPRFTLIRILMWGGRDFCLKSGHMGSLTSADVQDH